jgi:serine/threonine protein kinase
MEEQFIEIAIGKTLDKETKILKITRMHRNFEKITDPFQPVEPASDHVLQILRRNSYKCKNIIQVKDYNEDFVYVEWIDGKPLVNLSPVNSWMHESSQTINFTEILKSVKWLHSNGIAHLDIRAKNILVTEEGTPILIDILGAQPLDEEKRLRDLKDLRNLEEELLYTWYNRVTY